MLAVITAETLKTVNLAWMPTLAGDVQMVLADGKVLFQGQEVAFVVATDRYAADDGVDKVEVEYEALPALDRSVQGDGRPTPRCCARISPARPTARTASASTTTTSSSGQVGDKDLHRRRLQEGRRHHQGADLLPARPSVAAGDLPVRLLVRQDHGRADDLGHLPGAARDPHRGGADRQDSRAEDPRDLAGHRRRLRQQGRRLSRLYLRGGRLDRHRHADEVGRGPHREHVRRPRSPATIT